MPRTPKPESEDDKTSRHNLHRLVSRIHKWLGGVNQSVSGERSRLTSEAKDHISTLWRDADQKLSGVEEALNIGNPKYRRDELRSAGLFGGELLAKEGLFSWILEEKRFLAALRLVASICGSLARTFHVMSAVKEFIDAVLCARDWLPTDPEITSLGDLR